MFEGLISILEVPSLYQKTSVPFWNDNYISQQMLKAHLDPNFDGASRKLDFINKSVNWINKIAPPETSCQGLFNQIHKKATKKCQKHFHAPDTQASRVTCGRLAVRRKCTHIPAVGRYRVSSAA